MPLVNLDSPPSDSMRRWFGLSLGAVLAILAFVLAPPGGVRNSILCVAVAEAVIYYGLSKARLPIIRLWEKITFPIAWVIGHLLFGLVFFVLVTPIGLLLRLSGYDPLDLHGHDNAASNWKDKSTRNTSDSDDAARYFRQF